MKIYTKFADERRKEFQRLRRKHWTGWQFLLSGWWAEGGQYSLAKKKVWFAHTPDGHVWAILQAGFRRRIVAICETDPSCRTEEVLAAMMRKLDDDPDWRFEEIDCHGAIDFDRFWLLYTGEHFHEQPPSTETPTADGEGHSEKRMDNVIPLRKPPPGEKFDPQEVLRTFYYVQWKRENWKGMEEASKRKREDKAKRRRKLAQTKK